MPTLHSVSEDVCHWKTGTRVFRAGSKKHAFKSRRLAGIEWEYNSVHDVSEDVAPNYYGIGDIHNYNSVRSFKHLREWARVWHGGNHPDGSCGYEVVTAPLAGDHIAACITELGTALKLSNFKVDDDCSVHVHIGVKDFEWEDMYKLLEVYCKVEGILYAIGGDHRYDGEYCIPIGKKLSEALKTPNELYGGEGRKAAVLREVFNRRDGSLNTTVLHHSARCVKKDGGRYKGLNIIPWIVAKRDSRPDCTVEFRIHEHTKDPKRVIDWVHLLIRLVDWCKDASQEQIDSLPANQISALIKMCPDSKHFINKRVNSWKRLRSRILTQKRGVFFVKGEEPARVAPIAPRPRSEPRAGNSWVYSTSAGMWVQVAVMDHCIDLGA